MKSYLTELRGQVRGNARLRRRLDAREDELRRLRRHIQHLVTALDRLGHGDDLDVIVAAMAAGWTRYTPGVRAQIKEDIEKAFGVKL